MSIEAQALLKLIDAIRRRGTEQDGNWGWPTFTEELKDIENILKGEK